LLRRRVEQFECARREAPDQKWEVKMGGGREGKTGERLTKTLWKSGDTPIRVQNKKGGGSAGGKGGDAVKAPVPHQ